MNDSEEAVMAAALVICQATDGPDAPEETVACKACVNTARHALAAAQGVRDEA